VVIDDESAVRLSGKLLQIAGAAFEKARSAKTVLTAVMQRRCFELDRCCLAVT
jgi:hypothetical protein